MPLGVQEQSEEIKALACEWPILEALQGGTPAMRKAKTTYLPQFPNEESPSYCFRLNTTTLFPAYERTVCVMSAKPFAEPLTLSEDTPESVKTWAENIDLQGVSLHSFAAEMFKEMFYGLAGILVEYPAAAPEASLTVAQLEQSGRRPYCVRVMHDAILGYKTETVNGRVRLTQLRLAESTTEDDGEYGTKTIPCVRVLRPGSWEVWKQTSNEKTWELESSGTTSLTEIPFVPCYGIRDGFMVGKPPLLNLAYLNVEHWQDKSDQKNLLRAARVPILCMIGAEDETQLVLGAQSAVKLPQDADLKYVEHSGAAIGAGREALADLVQEMVQCGAELLVKKPSGDRTATQDNNEAEGNKCDLQRMSENFEDALDQVLAFMAQYASLPASGHVTLFSDFGASTLSDASATLIKDLQMAGLLSKETALKEIQRRGFLSPDVDVDEELERIESDGPPLGAQLDMMAIDAKQNADDERKPAR